jgi:two-component system nitrate/nitrite response regulator NarL
MERNVLTILVVPKTLVREGLASLLASTNYGPVICVSSIGELRQDSTNDADIALFIISRDALTKIGHDAALPELDMLRQQHPNSRVLVLSDTFNLADVLAALRAGANGYLMNTLTSDALVKSLDLVMLGETVLTSEFAQAVSDTRPKATEIAVSLTELPALLPLEEVDPHWNHLEHAVAHQLSSRETAILARLIRGDSNKHIARGIGVAEATVKTHVKAILRKIRVKNRTQAAMWAYTNLPVPLDADVHIAAPNGNGMARHLTNGS